MVLTQAYQNAFTEAYTILQYIDDCDCAKIPKEVITMIEENRNQDYEYKMNDDIDIFNQPMLLETKAILFNFYRDYWATPEQKEKIKKLQMEERQKIEEKKKIEYDNYKIFNNYDSVKKEKIGNINKTAILEVKEKNIFIRIINKIKSFFTIT